MLAAAHAFETFGGYEPCALCLRQRDVYWGAIALAGAVLVISRFWKRLDASRVPVVLLGLIFLTGAVVATYHAGAEWKFWPGPSTCSGGGLGGLSGGDILGALDRKGHAPSCDVASWRMAGISMAGYNALISLALAGLSFFAASAPPAVRDEDGRYEQG
jgi:disulfide bond formation protein DsbB